MAIIKDDRGKHRALMVVWLILLVPTVTLWRNSIVWIVFMSWYANFVGHWSGVEASKAQNGDKNNGVS